jgi:hypothetical protein
MTDEFDGFETQLARQLRSYTEPLPFDSRNMALTAMSRARPGWRPVRVISAALSVASVIIIAAALGVMYRSLMQPDDDTGALSRVSAPSSSESGPARDHAPVLGGIAPASTCTSQQWPPMPITCQEAESAVSTGANIDRTRVWLTTLATMQAGFPGARPRMALPPAGSPVWVLVYDGAWSCCLHADEGGVLQEPEVISRWLIVVDAASGDAVFVETWSDRPVPATLPPYRG